jgi:hypothetical protein
VLLLLCRNLGLARVSSGGRLKRMQCAPPERVRALERKHGLWDICLGEDDSSSFTNELNYLRMNWVDHSEVGNAGSRLTSDVSVAGRLAKLIIDKASLNKPRRRW